MLRTTRPGDTLEWPEDDKTGDGLPPLRLKFALWWKEHGQFCRAGGGDYEQSFAWAAWQAADAAAVARERQATQLCEKHKPYGGARSMCVICAGEKLQAALSRISYLCGEPNDMQCSDYDVHMNEDAVVEQVAAAIRKGD